MYNAKVVFKLHSKYLDLITIIFSFLLYIQRLGYILLSLQKRERAI